MSSETEIRIDFSDMQADSWVDSCLYGTPYGLLTGEDEHIQAEIEKLGYKKFTHIDLDNKNFQHLVVVDGV